MIRRFLFLLLIFISSYSLFCDSLSEEDLIRLDLLSSTKQELVLMAESLNLSSNGTKSQIYGRLLNYYGLTENLTGNENIFIINRAEQ